MKNLAHDDKSRVQLELYERISITLLGRVTCAPSWIGTRHAHDFYELVFISKKNPDTFHMEWEDTVHTSAQTALYLFPPHCQHQFFNGEAMAQNVYVGFEYNTSQSQAPLASPLHLTPDSAPIARLFALFTEIADADDEAISPLLMQRKSVVLQEVLGSVQYLSQSAHCSAEQTSRTDVLMAQIKQYIAHNLDRTISVDELAQQLYFSPNYLGQYFRQNTGMTVKCYHNKMRMEQALTLLASGGLSVGEVAECLGFDGVAYFSRRFKSFYGAAPSTFQSSARKPKLT